MNTMTHPVAPEEVMAFVDGELAGVGNEFVAGHIAGCEECQKAVAGFRESSQTLRGWKVPAVPQELESRINELVSNGKLPREASSPKFFASVRYWNWKQWAAGVGAAAALLLVSITIPNLWRSHVDVYQRMELARASRQHAPAASTEVQNYQRAVTESKNALEAKAGDQLSSSLENEEATSAQGIVGGIVPQAPMIARTVSLSMVVKDFTVSRGTLDAILARHHAYAAELTVNTTEGVPRTLQASLRVPAPELAAALNELKSLGRVENESQSGEEVTQQHADLLARLKNSRGTEQRLQAILQQRTGKISDVLEVEQEIARVRGEIEQMEAEQKSLEHRVDFATVNLDLADVYQAQLTLPSPSIGTRLRNGFVAGFHKAMETLLGITLFFAEDGPALLIWLVILGLPVAFVWRRYRRALAEV